MSNLGVLLADRLDPPDLTGARTWWEQAPRRPHQRIGSTTSS
jgi:hypothetical protein